MSELVLIIHDIRSCFNVGSLFRVADGLGVKKIFITGYTPYPVTGSDERLPHIAQRLDSRIHKTALGAEKSVAWEHQQEIAPILKKLKRQSYYIAALEQGRSAVPVFSFTPPPKLALIVGSEIQGIAKEILQQVDSLVEIPMLGKKESFNVSTAAAMALYQMRYKLYD